MSIEESTLGLAGVFQAATLVKQVARQGRTEENAFQVCMESLLKIDAASSEAVYNSIAGVHLGLHTLSEQFGSPANLRDSEVLRYALGILILEQRLKKRQDLLQKVRLGIEQAVEQVKLFGTATHTNVIARFADIYSETLSTFNYRIQVNGDPLYLQNPDNANKVRALLLAGVRSSVLWRQKGGGRFQLLFRRGTLRRQAQHYLNELDEA